MATQEQEQHKNSTPLSVDQHAKEPSIEEKLRALYNLQLVDSKIDQIIVLRGELPIQIRDLEDEITGLEARLAKHVHRLDALLLDHKNKKNHIVEAKKKLKQYEEQQKSIKNEREFNSIRSEIEYQELDIQLTEKQIKTLLVDLEALKVKKEVVVVEIDKQKEILEEKRKELSEIVVETETEEAELRLLSEQLSEKVELRLLKAYLRI